MASIVELHISQPETAGDNPSAELRYKILDTNNKETAHLLLRAFSPVTYPLISSGQTLVRQSTHIEPAGHDWWWGTAKYGRRKQGNDSKFTFDTTGGMTHITQSLGTNREGPAPGGPFGAPDFQGAIGVSNGKDVEGVDIYSPVFKWTETHYLPLAWVNDAYKLIVKHLTARTNDAAWRNHAAGEALFLGAVGSQRGEEDWEIAYHFAAGEDLAWTVGPLAVINKPAWAYGWVLYEPGDDANKIIKTPHSAYVETVYYEGDFNALLIGA